ncbi:thioredoxin domain-containing protein 16 isoform X10 [Mus musculus]|nr:thioredoxin domain-containing protein 16 isoform X10 [Mus musculus]|eukprot:XP_017171676.1 PREDICTED: thioredoxin domain-containing protein 16 isoform X9 [Mus musculus]
MEQPLTTLNIHVFVKTMNAPLLMEVAEDPQQVSTVHLQLGLPLVFIISQRATQEADRRTAEWVAWHLLGKAGVLLLLRDSMDVNIPQHANVAFRRAEKDVPVEFLVLNDVELIISHVKNNMHIEEIQEDEGEDMEGPDLAVEDDEVAGTVYRDRKKPLPLELSVELTEETFNTTVMTSDSIVLFYATWHAVSMAFLQSYIDVAIKLKGRSTILLTRINCADWSDICTKQNVTAFPVVKLYKEGESPVSYAGMLATKDLLKFIQLNKISCPVNIASIQEAEKYLRGELYKDLPSSASVSVLGLFSPAMASAKELFREAGKQLRGSVITGIYSEDDVWILSNKYATTLPALLLARPKEGRIESVPLDTTLVQDMAQILANALLEAFWWQHKPSVQEHDPGTGETEAAGFVYPLLVKSEEHSRGEGHLEGIFWPSATTSSAAVGESAFGWPSVCISFIPVCDGTKPCVVAETFTSGTRKSHHSLVCPGMETSSSCL